MMFRGTFFAFLLIVSGVKAGLLYNYQELVMKDVEQVSQIIEGKIIESKKTKYGKVVPLKEALQAVFSRPDHDGVLDKVISSLRGEIEGLKSWESVMTDLSNEALNALSNPKAFKPKIQVTYAIFLTNVVNYFKPELTSETFGKKIIQKIKDKGIVLTAPALKEIQLSVMKELVSPSEVAGRALEQAKEKPVE